MEDKQIIRLYFDRSEEAIRETAQQYGSYLHAIAKRILHSEEEAEESVNDTYHSAWNAIPPNWPDNLKLFLAKITRNISLDRLDYLLAKKRNSDITVLLEEIAECIPSNQSVEQSMESAQITEALNNFLHTLDKQSRIMFVERYWYAKSVKDIAYERHDSESKVKSSLFRTRKKLKAYLEQEGIVL